MRERARRRESEGNVLGPERISILTYILRFSLVVTGESPVISYCNARQRNVLRWHCRINVLVVGRRTGPPLRKDSCDVLLTNDYLCAVVVRVYWCSVMPTQGFNIKSVHREGLKLNVWDVGGALLCSLLPKTLACGNFLSAFAKFSRTIQYLLDTKKQHGDNA